MSLVPDDSEPGGITASLLQEWLGECNSKAEGYGNIQDFHALVVLAEASSNPVPMPWYELVFPKIASQLYSKPLLREGYVNHSFWAWLPEGPECLAGLIHPHLLLFLPSLHFVSNNFFEDLQVLRTLNSDLVLT